MCHTAAIIVSPQATINRSRGMQKMMITMDTEEKISTGQAVIHGVDGAKKKRMKEECQTLMADLLIIIAITAATLRNRQIIITQASLPRSPQLVQIHPR